MFMNYYFWISINTPFRVGCNNPYYSWVFAEGRLHCRIWCRTPQCHYQSAWLYELGQNCFVRQTCLWYWYCRYGSTLSDGCCISKCRLAYCGGMQTDDWAVEESSTNLPSVKIIRKPYYQLLSSEVRNFISLKNIPSQEEDGIYIYII